MKRTSKPYGCSQELPYWYPQAFTKGRAKKLFMDSMNDELNDEELQPDNIVLVYRIEEVYRVTDDHELEPIPLEYAGAWRECAERQLREMRG
jgi:hypothetical protein